jgi:N-methylhydantoinase B
VIDTILKALAPAIPEAVPAAHKGDMGGCSFFGFRESDGSRFLLLNIFGGGWGGRSDGDGESASVSICQGDVRNTPIELQEIKYPFVIEEHGLRPDSGGVGRYRGGLGVVLTYRCLQACKANINFERTTNPPWGLHGGGEGAINLAIIKRHDGKETTVYKETEISLHAGDRVTFLTAGGGGYGDPALRSREQIARDLVEGLVSPEGASVYGTQR